MPADNRGPEMRARQAIDDGLRAAGWIIQDRTEFNRNAAEGVAVREFLLPHGLCDYLLMVKLPDHIARWNDQVHRLPSDFHRRLRLSEA